MQTTILQERPSLNAIVANRCLDILVVLVGILIIALPFLALMKEIGIVFVVLAFAGALLGVLRMLADILEREYSLYTLESNRLVVDRGIFNRQRIVLPLDATRIQRVVAQQPIMGRLVGYGHVNIFTIGWGVVRLRYVCNPYAWQEDILQRLGQSASPDTFAINPPRSQTLSGQKGNTGLGRLLVAFSGLFLLVCVCSLVFSAGNSVFAKPTPIPTPQPGVLVFPNITIGDMFGALWTIYQIPTIFWLVNLAIIGNVVIFFMETIGRRRR